MDNIEVDIEVARIDIVVEVADIEEEVDTEEVVAGNVVEDIEEAADIAEVDFEESVEEESNSVGFVVGVENVVENIVAGNIVAGNIVAENIVGVEADEVVEQKKLKELVVMAVVLWLVFGRSSKWAYLGK